MDYILGDRFVTPLNERKNFSEKNLNFPDLYICFSPPKLNLEIVSTPALENGFVTFGCFNKASKISQDLVGTWSKILNGVPGSKIFFQGEGYSGEKGAIITQLFADNGIEPSRISLSGRRSREEMLTSYRQVDIALDTFPYPGGTTTCEALWMGVPTITKRVQIFSRALVRALLITRTILRCVH